MHRTIFLALLAAALVGCGKGKPTAPEGPPAPDPKDFVFVGASSPEVAKLKDALRPLGWTVNAEPGDKAPGPVNAAFVRSAGMKTEEDFAKLAKVLAEMKVPVILDLPFDPATDAWVKHITEVTSVVGFRADSGVTKASFPSLAKMIWLESLRLSADDSLTDADVAPLAALTKLKILEIDGPHKLTHASYAILAKMTDLRRFEFWVWILSLRDESAATEDDLSLLSRLTKLEELSLKGRDLTDASLARLSSLTGLRQLNIELSGSKITDSGLTHLTKLPKLETLRLGGTQITDAWVPSLKQLPALKTVLAEQTKITKAGAAELRAGGKITNVEVKE